jgi:futalosine hydrolase
VPVSPQLVIAATRREADAIVGDLGDVEVRHDGPIDVLRTTGVTVAVCGIGLAEAAATTARLLATYDVPAVFSIGVAGGYHLQIGSVAVGRSVTRADTCIEDADGTTRSTDDAIGLGASRHRLDSAATDKISARISGSTQAHVLSVATVTGTAERAAQVLRRAPGTGPAIEDMEAWGVLTAALLYDVPFFAVKAVSNMIGPRDRSTWDLDGALNALSTSASALFRDPPDWT